MKRDLQFMRRLGSALAVSLAPMIAATLGLGVAASAADAQSLRFIRRTGGYGSIGVGGGNFQIKCGGCTLGQLSSSAADLQLGFHFSRNVRLELGLQFQNSSATDLSLTTYTVGAGFYPVGALHVRGGVAFLKSNGSDPSGNFAGSKGTGFYVGAAYDLHMFTLLDRAWSLTPYVNYASASMSGITPTGATTTISGTGTSLSYGIAVHAAAGRWECTTASGTRIRLTRSNRYAFESCLNELRARLGQ